MTTSPIREAVTVGSPLMRAVVDAAEEAAAADSPVLIEGESGTGRELLARAIHYTSSRRRGEFVSLRLSSIPRAHLGDELAGASSLASSGTLLVKDIASLPFSDQQSMTRHLSGANAGGAAPSPRLIAATNVDLSHAVSADRFDAELYARIGARRILLPPLRKRSQELAALVRTFLRELAELLGRGRFTVSSRAMDRLETYAWPGNVPQLRDVLRLAVLRARSSRLDLSDIEDQLPKFATSHEGPLEDLVRSKLGALFDGMPSLESAENLHEEIMARVERPLIEEVLLRTHWNQVRAAAILGINRNTLRKLILRHGIQAPVRSDPRTP